MTPSRPRWQTPVWRVLTAPGAAFSATVTRLEATDCDQTRWEHLHTSAGQLGLLLAAKWPQQTLARLAQSALSPVAVERLGVSLLHRRDVLATLRSLITAPEQAHLREAVLHHLPEAAIEAHNAEVIAREVSQWQYRFKRCKEYILAHHADSLTPEQCRRLVAQLSLVPYGTTSESEKALQRVLRPVQAATKGRFNLADVDPIAIISAIRTKTL